MKKQILFATIIFLGVSLNNIQTARSGFVSSVHVRNEFQTDIYLDFYKNSAENAVGFRTLPVEDYDKIKYVISYEHDGGLSEVIPGTIDNSSANSVIQREWFTLGTCSAGGTCVYHNIEGGVDLNIEYFKGSTSEKTLNRTLSF